jgi:hypothetical protein
MLCLAVLVGHTTAVNAQIVAYRNAPGNQRPTVLRTANGVPLVNIQTPSAQGVSRNVYRQFDVDSNGVILNNARNQALTRLAGYVQGNPWLALGTARVNTQRDVKLGTVKEGYLEEIRWADDEGASNLVELITGPNVVMPEIAKEINNTMHRMQSNRPWCRYTYCHPVGCHR